MKKGKWMVLFSTVVIFLTLSLPAAAGKVVKLGVNEVRSGAFKSNGDRIIWGIEAAVKEFNDTGGLKGTKVELVIEDNRLKGEIAAQKTKKLIFKDKCQIILQGSSSGVGNVIAQEMPKYKKIYLAVGAAAMPMTTTKYTPYTFRAGMNAAMHMKALAKYFGRKGYKKVFIIGQDYSWGHDVAKYYEMYIKRELPDTEIVGNMFHKVFNKDFGPFVRQIMASGADYVVTGNWGTDLAQFILQSRSLGMKIPIGSCWLDDDGVASVTTYSAMGVISANMYTLGVDTPRAQAFENRFYKSSGGKWPSFVAMIAYIGTTMYLEAVKNAGTFDTQPVIEAMEALVWEGPVGALSFREQDHQIVTPAVIAEAVGESKYYNFPYIRPIKIIPAEDITVSLKEGGWRPYKP